MAPIPVTEAVVTPSSAAANTRSRGISSPGSSRMNQPSSADADFTLVASLRGFSHGTIRRPLSRLPDYGGTTAFLCSVEPLVRGP